MDKYRKLGINQHKMKYIKMRAEDIKFPDGYFDIVSSFNSFDHFDDLEKVIKEIKRTITSGGYFLLLTDIHENPRVCEPQTFSWEIVREFEPELKLLHVQHYEKPVDGIYESIKAGIPYDHTNKEKRDGVLSAKFIKLKG